ncbi:DNA/RNA non-specific endonuclease [Paenibacillus yonginensis]|nr:DNA/RNA non-specific endonuclease [Paenibacillus yonginensis]
MRIEAEITGIKQTGQRLASASQNLSQLRDSLRRTMGGLTMESRRRPEIDSQYQQIDRWLWELGQEMETLSRYTARKAEQFADDDNHSLQLKSGTGWSWKNSLGNVLDFLPVIGNIEGLIEALSGRDTETGGKLEGWERLLYGIGPLGKGVLQGAKLLGAADELAEGIQFVSRATAEAGAKLQSVGKATLEGLQEGVEVGWDFIQGAKSAIQEDMSLGFLKDPEREYEHPISEKVGELTGHTVGTVLGALETLIGLGGEAGSIVLDATGVGTLVGVPGMAASAALAAYGLTSAKTGAAGVGSSARDLVQMVKGEGKGEPPTKTFVDSPFDEAGKLKPNVKYKAGEHQYDYETDHIGRIEKFSTDELKLTTREERLPHDSDTPGKEPGDHAGHLAGDRFGGSPEIDNLVSQSSNVNLSQYKKIENQWAVAIKEGKNVKVNVEVKYDGDSLRPSKFNVDYEIDGEVFSKSLLN